MKGEETFRPLLDLERVEAISDEMRVVIEELWPELVHKLPPRRRLCFADDSHLAFHWARKVDNGPCRLMGRNG